MQLDSHKALVHTATAVPPPLYVPGHPGPPHVRPVPYAFYAAGGGAGLTAFQIRSSTPSCLRSSSRRALLTSTCCSTVQHPAACQCLAVLPIGRPSVTCAL